MKHPMAMWMLWACAVGGVHTVALAASVQQGFSVQVNLWPRGQASCVTSLLAGQPQPVLQVVCDSDQRFQSWVRVGHVPERGLQGLGQSDSLGERGTGADLPLKSQAVSPLLAHLPRAEPWAHVTTVHAPVVDKMASKPHEIWVHF